ncbi:hypothetical protein HYY71_05250 [Candidatus Woesearchaeota archaeon]|nr:hypothetical protein [Candidatus Woesearchaeota archaeon]
MKKTTKNILAVAGVIGTILGIILLIPSFLQTNYIVSTISVVLIVAGLVMLAIAFGD